MSIKRKILLILFLCVVSLGAAAAWSGIAALCGAYLYLTPRLPEVESLKEIQMQEPLRVYSRDGSLLAEFGEKQRIPVVMDEVPMQLRQAFLAAEDERFMEHPGVDYRGLIRAVLNQILTGDKSQGGSTITMQVARNFFLSREKTYLRKLNEIFLALKIEKELSKDTILELYLNKIFFGKRAWGVAAAARVYYGKSLAELELPEIAMIAGLPKAPSTFNPIVNPERALARRDYVLGRMLELNFISAEEYAAAIAVPVTAKTHEVMIEVEAPYVAEMVRQEIIEQYGEEVAYTSGLKVYATIDSTLQAAANRALSNGLLDYEARHGYKGPIQNLILPDGAEAIEIVAFEEDEAGESEEVGLNNDIGKALPELDESEGEGSTGLALEATNIYFLPQAEADNLINEAGYFAGIFPALILSIKKTVLEETVADEVEQPVEVASVYLGKGSYGELSFEGVKWAVPFVSVNQLGNEPEKILDVLRMGDLVWLRTSAEGLLSLAQMPEVEGALVSLNSQTGALVALVGGFDFSKSKFNRAVQARRQPGSGFKPFVYSAALENGFTAASIINDAPVVFDDPALEGKWRPENYSGKFYGDTRLRQGLIKSRNLVSIRLLIALGTRKAREFARRFGFDDEALPNDLSLALGSGTVTPMQMAAGFSVFANGGYKVEPFFIDRIEDAEGKVIQLTDYQLACLQCVVDKLDPVILADKFDVEWPPELEGEPAESDAVVEENQAENINDIMSNESDTADVDVTEALESAEEVDADAEELEEEYRAPKRILKQAPQIVEPRIVYIMSSILRDVVKFGTGRRAMGLGRDDLAGKTGTSNDEHDAWFNGFNLRYVTSTWVGFDGHQPLGRREQGGRAALPIWMDYMRAALEGVADELPKQPENIVSIKIDAKTGLLATAATSESLFEIFRSELVPTEQSEEGIGAGGDLDINGNETNVSVDEELF